MNIVLSIFCFKYIFIGSINTSDSDSLLFQSRSMIQSSSVSYSRVYVS